MHFVECLFSAELKGANSDRRPQLHCQALCPPSNSILEMILTAWMQIEGGKSSLEHTLKSRDWYSCFIIQTTSLAIKKPLNCPDLTLVCEADACLFLQDRRIYDPTFMSPHLFERTKNLSHMISMATCSFPSFTYSPKYTTEGGIIYFLRQQICTAWNKVQSEIHRKNDNFAPICAVFKWRYDWCHRLEKFQGRNFRTHLQEINFIYNFLLIKHRIGHLSTHTQSFIA